MIGRPIGSLEEKFWNRVALGEKPDDCWLWTGSLRSDGYGQLRVRNAQVGSANFRAHHLALMFAGIEVDAERLFHHVCGNRACVNPDHLQQMAWDEHSRHHRREEKQRELWL